MRTQLPCGGDLNIVRDCIANERVDLVNSDPPLKRDQIYNLFPEGDGPKPRFQIAHLRTVGSRTGRHGEVTVANSASKLVQWMQFLRALLGEFDTCRDLSYATKWLILATIGLVILSGHDMRGQDARHPTHPQIKIIQLRSTTIKGPLAITQTGTGWCGDTACTLVVTSYHVNAAVHPTVVGGHAVLSTYESTGSADEGSRSVTTAYGKEMRLNPARDVAVLRMASTSITADEVVHLHDIAPSETATLLGCGGAEWPLRFERVVEEMLWFSFLASQPAQLAGCSGSPIVDSGGAVVGMLSQIGSNGTVLAVSPQEIAAAIHHTAGIVAPDHTPNPVLPASALYNGLGVPFPTLPRVPVALISRHPESTSIQSLRASAQQMVAAMSNLQAVQTLHFRTSGKPEIVWRHRLQVDNNAVVFVSLATGRESSEAGWPPHRRATSPGVEWRDLPRILGSPPKLRIEQGGQHQAQGKVVNVFRYEARPEDGVCRVGYGRRHIYTVSCRGEVWAEEDNRILRITQELDAPYSTNMRLFQLAVLYGEFDGRMVPASMVVRADIDGHPTETIAEFTDYRRRGATQE